MKDHPSRDLSMHLHVKEGIGIFNNRQQSRTLTSFVDTLALPGCVSNCTMLDSAAAIATSSASNAATLACSLLKSSVSCEFDSSPSLSRRRQSCSSRLQL